jgi:hypothetical protein
METDKNNRLKGKLHIYFEEGSGLLSRQTDMWTAILRTNNCVVNDSDITLRPKDMSIIHFKKENGNFKEILRLNDIFNTSSTSIFFDRDCFKPNEICQYLQDKGCTEYTEDKVNDYQRLIDNLKSCSNISEEHENYEYPINALIRKVNIIYKPIVLDETLSLLYMLSLTDKIYFRYDDAKEIFYLYSKLQLKDLVSKRSVLNDIETDIDLVNSLKQM